MRDAGVKKNDRDVIGFKGIRLMAERSAIEAEGFSSFAEDVDVHIHDAALDTDEIIFGSVGEFHDRKFVEVQFEQTVQAERQPRLDRSR